MSKKQTVKEVVKPMPNSMEDKQIKITLVLEPEDMGLLQMGLAELLAQYRLRFSRQVASLDERIEKQLNAQGLFMKDNESKAE